MEIGRYSNAGESSVVHSMSNLCEAEEGENIFNQQDMVNNQASGAAPEIGFWGPFRQHLHGGGFLVDWRDKLDLFETVLSRLGLLIHRTVTAIHTKVKVYEAAMSTANADLFSAGWSTENNRGLTAGTSNLSSSTTKAAPNRFASSRDAKRHATDWAE